MNSIKSLKSLEFERDRSTQVKNKKFAIPKEQHLILRSSSSEKPTNDSFRSWWLIFT